MPTVGVVIPDEARRRAAVDSLQGLAPAVRAAASAGEFLAALPADLLCVLADTELPGGGAIGLLRQLRARGCAAPVLVLADAAEVEAAVAAIRAGALDYVEYGMLQRPLARHLGRLLAEWHGSGN